MNLTKVFFWIILLILFQYNIEMYKKEQNKKPEVKEDIKEEVKPILNIIPIQSEKK